jgi:hypothetical protein
VRSELKADNTLRPAASEATWSPRAPLDALFALPVRITSTLRQSHSQHKHVGGTFSGTVPGVAVGDHGVAVVEKTGEEAYCGGVLGQEPAAPGLEGPVGSDAERATFVGSIPALGMIDSNVRVIVPPRDGLESQPRPATATWGAGSLTRAACRTRRSHCERPVRLPFNRARRRLRAEVEKG